MSHFYATIRGHRGEATRMGTARSGIRSNTAGWNGCISVCVHERNSQDHYQVSLTPWHGSGGGRRIIAEGPLDSNAPDFITRGAALGSRDLDMWAVLETFLEITAANFDAAASKIEDADLSVLADVLTDCAMMIRNTITKANP